MCALCRADEVIVSTEEAIVKRVHDITGNLALHADVYQVPDRLYPVDFVVDAVLSPDRR